MIRVITGPPCGGKSTFVTENALPGDIVIDMDLIASAMVVDSTDTHDYSNEVRQIARRARKVAVKEALRIGQVSRRNVWIVHTSPDSEWQRIYRLHNAKITEVDPGRDECLRRLADRPATQHVLTKRVIDDWYARR